MHEGQAQKSALGRVAADAAFKRMLLKASRNAVVQATADKFAMSTPYRIAPSEAIHCFVASHDTPAAERATLAQQGCTVFEAGQAA